MILTDPPKYADGQGMRMDVILTAITVTVGACLFRYGLGSRAAAATREYQTIYGGANPIAGKEFSPQALKPFPARYLAANRYDPYSLLRFTLPQAGGEQAACFTRSSTRPQDQPLTPNIMRLATNFLSCGRQSSALNPMPRAVPKMRLSLEKSFTSESVNVRPMLLSNLRLLL